MGVERHDDFETYYPYRTKLFDKENKTVLGRDFESWLKLGIFYLVFYAVLIALFAIFMWVFFQTLDPRIPKWKLSRSLIGDNPGLGFRPLADDVESTLIWLEAENITFGQEVNHKWIARLNDFLGIYYTPGKVKKGTASAKTCSYTDYPRQGEVCNFDVTLWGPCSKDNKFMFYKSTPCIFLKLNKIYGWIPDYIMRREEFPKDMPPQLKDHIERLDDNQKRTVWVTCEGETPTDVEYLGPVHYYPKIQGFPGYYYPYVNTEGYLSPLIAVHFAQPKQGIVINIECKAWAKNIQHSRAQRMGSVHFELLIGGSDRK